MEDPHEAQDDPTQPFDPAKTVQRTLDRVTSGNFMDTLVWLDDENAPAASDARTLRRPLSEGSHLHGASSANQRHGFVLGETLGEGGNALVRSAEQLSLRRSVAAKTPLYSSEKTRAGLLQEAYITGALEHPNIVPVHDLVFDDEGHPTLVLKRIEGDSWHQRMHEGDTLLEGRAIDPLTWNIDIVIGVSRALSFAHQRGIIHRDIKPANVMIGRFGEVYLLDWGLGVSVDAHERFLPKAPPSQVAGTAAYMAPEQWTRSEVPLGPHTDVYLLAASLFHALCGYPPWRRVRGQRERVPVDKQVPLLLQEIIEAALCEDVKLRTQTALELRQELGRYLRQRGSIHLADQATRHVRAAESARLNGDTETAEYASMEAAATFRAALAQWSMNPAAIEGQLALTHARVEDALARSQPHVADRILSTLDVRQPVLRARVDEALTRATRHSARAEAIRHNVDRSVGVNERRNFVGFAGPIWIIGWLIAAITERPELLLTVLLGGGAIWGIAIRLKGQALLSNQMNRKIIVSIVFGLVTVTAIALISLHRHQSLLSVAPFFITLLTFAAGTSALIFDFRMIVVALVWLTLFPLALIWPSSGLWLTFAGNVVMVAGFGWADWDIAQRAQMSSEATDFDEL